MKSVDGIVSIPASHAAIFAPSNDRFATAMMFKTVFDLRVALTVVPGRRVASNYGAQLRT
ncbi:hypothetical protein GWE18_21475 [Bradyrhizobium sp. CSA112]|uniref:hypothetical protein n=1 Tax=Bradyrhizobium sp. CSA112 TaxID=2699170 RepID=UPI0023B0D072|nr:hypothetical protein [Bradyrhizobium sp. CSA112]MDE5455363.1 hypothetical protein [Bradyrhizobium sp. CSA112]